MCLPWRGKRHPSGPAPPRSLLRAFSSPQHRRMIFAKARTGNGAGVASEKKRLDVLLGERGLAETRAKAQALILAGAVFSGEKKLDKAGTAYSDDTPLEVK